MSNKHSLLDNLAAVESTRRYGDDLEKEAFGIPAFLKTPEAKGAMKKFLLGSAGVAGAFGTAAALKGIEKELASRKSAKMRNHYFNSMVAANPGIPKKGPEADLAQKHFDTIYKFNPSYAKDPLVAGAYVSQSLDMVQPNINILNSLVSAYGQHKKTVEPATSTIQEASDLARMVSGGLDSYDKVQDKLLTARKDMLQTQIRARGGVVDKVLAAKKEAVDKFIAAGN